MKRYAALAAMIFSMVHAQEVHSVDGIVAIVNNSVITESALNRAVGEVVRNNPNTKLPENLKQQVLEMLVDRRLLIQAAEKSKISVSDAQVEKHLQQLAAKEKTTPDTLLKKYTGLRDTLHDELMVDKMTRAVKLEKGQVSDEEAAQALQAARANGLPLPEGVTDVSYHAHHILIKGDDADAQKLALSLYGQLRSGADFETLARQYSQDASGKNGGDLGWLNSGETVDEFESALKQLKPGEISRPVKTEFGWHIIRLDDVHRADSPEERQLGGMREALSREKTDQAIQELLHDLKQQSFVQIRPVK